MTIRNDILRVLRENPEGLSDAEITARLGKLHQQVNDRCRALAVEGHIRRDTGAGAIRNVLVAMPTPPGSAPGTPVTPQSASATDMSASEEMRSERNTQAAIVAHLAANGWNIERVADTASHERGFDIVAERHGQQLLVEVKGYPSRTYARGDHAGQPKPTHPSTQADMWLAQALLKAMRTRGRYPDAHMAIGLPDMPRYRSLLTEITDSLTMLDVQVLLVHENRSVTDWRTLDAPA